MDTTWAQALKWVRQDEGGNDDDPSDHGGRTSRGITQREYDYWRHAQGLPMHDVWRATDGEIDHIYHDKYWLPYGPILPPGADYLWYDANVNSGQHRANVLLQQALGVSPDGQIGPITLGALAKVDPSRLIERFTAIHVAFFNAISHHPGQRKFLQGWLNRAHHVEQRAVTLIPKPTGYSA